MPNILLQNIDAAYLGVGQEGTNLSIRISGNEVTEVGRGLAAEPGDQVISCTGKVAFPGLINTHHHFFQLLTRCLPGGQNCSLFPWLRYHYPIWKHVDSEMFRAASRAAIAELLLSGCTFTSDHLYLFPRTAREDVLQIEIESARELGIRFAPTRGAMTLGQRKGGLPPDEIVEDDDKVLAHCEAHLAAQDRNERHAMCDLHLAPCSPFNVTEYLMRESAALANKHGARLHTHLAETDDEDSYCLSRYGKRPLDLLEAWGWLDNKVWIAHGIHFEDHELDMIAQSGMSIAHCPSSNMRLGSGRLRLREMRERGIKVGLAVDGCASNDCSHMMTEVRQALLLHRSSEGASAITARRALDLATSGSASVLGRSDVGTIEIGQAADVALFDLDALGYAGGGDPIAAPIFCAPGQRAWMVIVNGKIVVEDGTLCADDEREIARSARENAKRLRQISGLER
ncbi:8-oxoguanine deaminase [bacterium]|nr:8-oxoguanine deaminase [bacterium]